MSCSIVYCVITFAVTVTLDLTHKAMQIEGLAQMSPETVTVYTVTVSGDLIQSDL